MDLLSDLGMIACSARLRRLSDQLTQDVLEMYKSQFQHFDLRYASIFVILHQRETITSSEISQALGYTKSAVSQTLGSMLQEGLIEELPDPDDRRKKHLRLSASGKQMVQHLEPLWDKAEHVFRQIQQESGIDLLRTLSDLEECMEKKRMIQRYREME